MPKFIELNQLVNDKNRKTWVNFDRVCGIYEKNQEYQGLHYNSAIDFGGPEDTTLYVVETVTEILAKLS